MEQEETTTAEQSLKEERDAQAKRMEIWEHNRNILNKVLASLSTREEEK
jgi:hypothetical protein